MNLGTENNLKIVKKFCIGTQCPKLQKAKTYEEKVSVCSQCIDKLYKYDMLVLIEELLKEKEKTPKLERYRKGKGLELSDKDVERVLLLIKEEKTTNQIKEETGYSWRTIDHIRNLTFKNPDNNEKVKQIKRELQLKGRL